MRIRRKRFEEQKSALNDQHVREINFRETAINTHTIVSVSDSDARITEVNENFEKLFGYTSDEIVGQNQSILYPHKHLDKSYLEIKHATEEMRVWTGEQKLVTKAGEQIFVNTTVVPQYDEKGRHLRNISMRTDVTAARVAEADEFLRSMLEELQDEVYIYDVETLTINYMNRSARERNDWDLSEIRQKSIIDTSPNFDEGAFRQHVARLIDGTLGVVSIEVIHPKGPAEITTRIVDGADGKPLFVSLLRDISWRKKVEEAKFESVSIVSHELRTPLTSIKGALRLLQSGVIGDFDAKTKSVIDIASRNSDRLLTVVNDILDFEKLQADKMNFDMSVVDLVRLAEEAVAVNKHFADEHNVEFEVVSDTQTATVLGNSDRLMQVLTNLMSNAVKFSPSKSVVTVSIEDKGGTYRVAVQDRGPGIPDSERQKLFKSFSQTVPADGLKRDGTGLGLVIVKSILKRHGCQIDFDSTVGVGSEFFFELNRVDSNINDKPTPELNEAG